METLATVKNEQNLLVIQNAFENFLKGNIAGITDACTDDIVWSAYHHPVVPYSGEYHGKKGVGDFFATLASTTDYTAFETKEFYADGDTVLVKAYHEAIVKATGKKFGHDFLMQFKLRNGKVAYYFAFIDINDQANAFTK